MYKVLHVISGLGVGGAEKALLNLVSNNFEFEHVVVCLSDNIQQLSEFQQFNVEVIVLNVKSKGLVKSIFLLKDIIKSYRPHVVQTWMYHANLIGGIASKIAFHAEIVWNVRRTDLSLSLVSKSSFIIAYLCSGLSYFVPKKIIYCAQSSRVTHERIGYSQSKSIVIANTVDITKFNVCRRTDYDSVNPPFKLVSVGRYDPSKDYKLMVESLSRVRSSGRNVELTLAGKGLVLENSELLQVVRKHDVCKHVHLIGPTKNVPELLGSSDAYISTSRSEGFPNVLIEAMASGLPCIATDAGDSHLILGDTGFICLNSSIESVVRSICLAHDEFINDSEVWAVRRLSSRRRVEDTYSMDRYVTSYSKTWRSTFENKK